MEGIRENNRKMEWWDEECRTEKAKVRRELRKWRREREEGDKYREMKLKYRRLCEKKKREEIVRWIKEGQIWKIINRERKNRKRVTTRGKRRNRNEGMGGIF